MRFNRRTFLKQAGLTLLTGRNRQTGILLLGQRQAASQINRYLEVIAQPTARKLALLVGINEYSNSNRLSGCVTDVELQRELLIHRFGFHKSDVVTLTDQQATRETLETTFIEHLLRQAAPEDVAVFHFSGYGSLVKVVQSPKETEALSQLPTEQFVHALVTADGISSIKDKPAINPLLLERLQLLAHSLATEKVTLVLDTSYESTGKVLQGNLRVRSCPNPPEASLEEQAFQETLQLQLSNTELPKQTRGRSLSYGIVLSAAQPEQAATEATWNGFSAGIFTHALTQYLWQVTPASTVTVSLTRTAEKVEQLTGEQQQPQLTVFGSQPLLTYYLLPDRTGAEGIITAVEADGTAQVLLAGLPAIVLDNYGTNSCLAVVLSANAQARVRQPATANPEEVSSLLPEAVHLLQIRSREGLTAKARLLKGSVSYTLEANQLVQEWIRVFPRNIGLTVALSDNLERIERVDATSAFANIAIVSSVVTAGGQAADCLLAKTDLETLEAASFVAETRSEDSKSSSVAVGYRLFSVGGIPLANTLGTASEAVKSAVRRLVPRFKTLLAAKLWRLTTNDGSSRLGVRATLEIADPQQKLMQKETRGQMAALQNAVFSQANEKRSSLLGDRGQVTENRWLPTLKSNTRLQLRVENYGDRPIYVMLLGLDSGGSAIALYSTQPELLTGDQPPIALNNRLIAAGETSIIPQPSTSISWMISGPPGLAEFQLICSSSPFTQAGEALAAKQHHKEQEQILDLPNALEVTQAVLQDLHVASAASPDLSSAKEEVYSLDVNAWAAFNFVCQVI